MRGRSRVLYLSLGQVRGCVQAVSRAAGLKGALIMTTPTTAVVPSVVAEYLAAVNAFDLDRMVATFAEDAYVNDARREIRGIGAIRAWAEKEMIGDRVTMEPVEVVEHYGQIIVRSRYDGTYDKTSLPVELVMSDYFSVRDGKIVSLAVIRNQPCPY